MATVTLIELLASGVVTSSGAPVASGKVRAYQLGTLTPETIYSDNAGATPITQPLTLTAGGTGIAYFANPIRLILKDATDTSTLLDVNIVGGSPASTFITSTSFNSGNQTTLQAILDAVDDSFGGRDWKYKHSSTATERYLKTWMAETQVSAADYGALGDDSTNNLTALQNAINAASGGVLYIPAGTYRFTGALTIPAGGMTVIGAGRHATILKQMGTTDHGFVITPTATSTGGTFTNFSRLAITCGTTSTGTAIRSVLSGTNTTSIQCVDVLMTGAVWTNAIVNTTTGGYVKISECIVSASGDCLTSSLNTVAVVNGTISSSGGKGISSTSANVVGSSVSGSTSAITVTSVLSTVSTSTSGGVTVPVGGSVRVAGAEFDAVTDQRTGSPVAFTLSGTNSVTPLPLQSQITKIVQSGGGATTTINAPAGALFGTYHTIICSNTSGGALTWTFNAAFKTSAAVAPATGNRISVLFYYDAVDAKWSEISRSAAVPN